jgi:hypothetical protein
MNNDMIFLGGHAINFSVNSRREIIDDIGFRLQYFKFDNPSFFETYEQETYKSKLYLIRGNTGKWTYSDVSLNGQFGDTRTVFLIGGPYGLFLRISNTYIEFLYPSFKKNEWYSTANYEVVKQWRDCFKQIINLLGGHNALYITSLYFSKYYDFFMEPTQVFEQKIYDLSKKQGNTQKGFKNFREGNHPWYFIDALSDNF